jgi:hypothetical protein
MRRWAWCVAAGLLVTGCTSVGESLDTSLAALPAFAEIRPELLNELTEFAAQAMATPDLRPRSNWAGDQAQRVIVVTVPSPQGRAMVSQGSGLGWTQAIRTALQPIAASSYGWLKLDVVGGADSFRGNLEPGFQGVGFRNGLLLLPEELTHLDLHRGHQLRKGYQERLPEHWGKASAESQVGQAHYRLHIQSSCWFKGRVYPLRRGHRQLTVEQINPEELLSAAKLAGQHLLTQLGPEGRFTYIYRPDRDQIPQEYNLLRHAGACYALAQLAQETQQREYRDGARRALKYLLLQVRPDAQREGLYLVEGKHVKLGGNALAIVALLEFSQVSGEAFATKEVKGLAQGLLQEQLPDGSFPVHKREFATREASDFVSGYYPGEAIVALMALHRHDPSGPWLKAAQKAARYLIVVRDKGLASSQLPHDHWLMLGLSSVQQAAPDPIYPRHLTALSKAICSAQIRQSSSSDWLGGFYQPPRSGPTSIRMEGLCAGHRWVSQAVTDEVEQTLMGASLYLLQSQLQPEFCAYFRHPQKCLGGIPRSLSNSELRIDYDQHFISALLAHRQILQQRIKSGRSLPGLPPTSGEDLSELEPVSED